MSAIAQRLVAGAGLALAVAAGTALAEALRLPMGLPGALWPPAGIALAVLLARGRSLWPAAAVGVLFAHLVWPVCAGGSWRTALLLSAGTTGQALMAATVLLRLGIRPERLLDDAHVLRLLLVGGVLASSVGAAVVAVGMSGVIPPPRQLLCFALHWIGSAAGVLLFTPPILAWLGRGDAQLDRLRNLLLLATLPVAGLYIAILADTGRREQLRVEAEFNELVEDGLLTLRGALSDARLLAEAAAAHVASHDDFRCQEFDRFADALLAERPTLRSLQFSRRVAAGELDALRRWYRQRHGRELVVREWAGGGPLVPASTDERPRVVIVCLRPWEGNDAALGYDVLSNPEVATVLSGGNATAIRVSPPLTLAQEPDGGRGVVLYRAVLRDAAIFGYSAAVLYLPQLVAPVQAELAAHGVGLALHDVTGGQPQALFETGPTPVGGELLQQDRLLDFGGRNWRARFSADARVVHGRLDPFLLLSRLAGACAVVLLLVTLLLVLIGRGIRVERLVAERSAALAASNRALREREAALHRLLRDLRQSETRLRESMIELRQANRSLEQFVHLASHDLKAPLRSVASFAQLVERRLADHPDPQVHEYLGFVRRGAHTMHQLIEDLLALTRLRRDALRPREVALRQVLDAALESLHADIEASAARIEVDSLPVVHADPGMLRQVFQNLIANAIKFQPPGQRPQVCIAAAGERDGWRITVRDNGIGIPPDQLERVFELFARSSGDAYDGTGVGLALCRKILELHGGWIRAELPGDGPGTIIAFWLPGGSPEAA